MFGSKNREKDRRIAGLEGLLDIENNRLKAALTKLAAVQLECELLREQIKKRDAGPAATLRYYTVRWYTDGQTRRYNYMADMADVSFTDAVVTFWLDGVVIGAAAGFERITSVACERGID